MNLNLKSGLYKEEEIIKNLKKNKMKSLLTKKSLKNTSKSLKTENISQIDIDDVRSIKETFCSVDSKNLVKNIIKKIEFDEDYINDIRQYLNISFNQKEFKDKGVITKKLIPIYKKIHNDKDKTKLFLSKIAADLLYEKYEDINKLVEFEYMKEKRERLFTNMYKTVYKFIESLKEKRINDINDLNTILSNDDINDKIKILQEKVEKLLILTKDIK